MFIPRASPPLSDRLAARTTFVRWLRTVLRSLGLVSGGLVALYATYWGLTWELRARGASAEIGLVVVPIGRGTLRETVAANGKVEPLAHVIVQSEIPGIIARVDVDNGDRVIRGQPLVDLATDRLASREQELAAALATREAIAAENLVTPAQIRLADAQRRMQRAERLHREAILSTEEYQTTADRVRLATYDLGAARVQTDARQAAVAEARAALSRAQQDLKKTSIRSPIDGLVVARKVEVGSAVADVQNGGTVLVTLADDSKLHLLADVDENDIAHVRVGLTADVRVDALSGETFAGFVRKVSPSGSAAGSVSIFRIEIELPPDPRIRVGMSADARVVVHEHRDVLLVPSAAVTHADDGAYVQRVPLGASADDSERVAVTEGYSDGFQTIVDTGLVEGDRLLVRPDVGAR